MMKTVELNLARIGNSRGIRLPADMIRRHGLESGMLLEERENELVIRPKDDRQKLSWEETAREMVAAAEDWSEWDAVTADGLESIPWDPQTAGASSHH
jgi:antitoxin component of MazEF toxin-antitoxin module